MNPSARIRVQAATAAFLLTAAGAFAGRTNHWVSTSAGNWSNTANWSDTSFYPNGAGDVAYIDVDVLASLKLAVTLDVPVTLGELHLRNRGFEIKAGSTSTIFTFDSGVTGRTALFHAYERTVGNVGTCVVNPSLALVSDLLVQDDDYGLKFASTSKATANATNRVLTLCMNTPLQGDAVLETGDLSTFTGVTVVRRDSANGSGIYLGTTTARFPGGPVVLLSSAYARYAVTFTDAMVARFDTRPGAQHILRGTASLSGTTHPETLLGEHTRLTLGDSNSAPLDRWPNAVALPLNGTRVHLGGYNTVSTLETVGALSYTNGCWVSINNAGAAYETSLLPASLERRARGTLLVTSENTSYPIGTANCRVAFATAPTLVNGLVPPSLVVAAAVSGTSSANAMPSLASYHATLGLQPAAYDLTNAFGTSNQTVRVMTTPLNLGGATVDCYALFAGSGPDGNMIYNGTVRVHSGLMAITGAYNKHAASYVFGATGAAEALVYVPSGVVETRVNDGLTGALTCNGLTKSGSGLLRLSGSNTGLQGSIRVNQGNLAIDAAQGVSNANDLWLGYGSRLSIAADAVNLGGLSSAPDAIVQMERTTSGSTLTLAPPAGTEHLFVGAIRPKDGTVGLLTVRAAGSGVQVLSGSVDAALAVSNGGTLALDGVTGLRATVLDAGGTLRLDGTSTLASLDASAASTCLAVGPAAPLAVTGACALPATVRLPAGAIARGTYTLVDAGSLTGALPGLDADDATLPAGLVPRLAVDGTALVLRVDVAGGTVVLLR